MVTVHENTLHLSHNHLENSSDSLTEIPLSFQNMALLEKQTIFTLSSLQTHLVPLLKFLLASKGFNTILKIQTT